VTLRSLHNHHNFFSDYWLGTLLTSRAAAPRLSAAELRKRMRRLTRLVDSLTGASRLEPARFRERFAVPLLNDVFDFAVAEDVVVPHVHLLRPIDAEVAAPPITLVYLCDDASEIDRRGVRQALEEALGAEGLDHGLILTPETFRLIRRAGDGPRQGALDVALSSLRDLEDADSLQAAYRLLSAASFIAGSDGRRPIDALEAESLEHSAKVSAELKNAVFEAAEQLVGAFQRDVVKRAAEFPAGTPSLGEIRDAGFLALYRLLFILYAESRDERLATHGLYRESYGLEALIGTLLATPPEMLAANRTRLWSRLFVLFRVFNEGLSPNLPDLENIPPRGGRLFSETTREGALLTRLSLDDRACSGVLMAIATTRPRRGVGRERVSFRELEIEQLGAVYEGLLEYEPAVAEELRFAVRAGGRELVLTPEELVFLCDRKRLQLSGDAALVVGTAAEQLHPGNAPEETNEGDDETGESDDDEEEEADDGVTLRSGQSIRLLRRLDPGTFHFRSGAARKASGSFYTPTPMVEFLVQEAISPLIAGRTSAEIEHVRVVDLACGSAHFLVGAARYLGARLFQAYRSECGDDPPVSFVPPSVAPSSMRARWAEEGAAWCKRRIVERCLYGVDLNPAAVQLAQVALWIESLAGDRPLSFFAHHIRVGNSLQGTFAERFDSPPDPRLSLARRDAETLGLFESKIRERIEAALGERRLIDAELPPAIRADTPEEFQYKEDRLRQSDAALAEARLLMDLRSAAPYLPAIWPDLTNLSGLQRPEDAARTKAWWQDFQSVRARERFFHWELEFPEVLLRVDRPGFDVVLGNPPWDKVIPNKREFYADVDPLVIAFQGNELDHRIRQLHREHPDLERRYEFERDRTTTFARVLRKAGDFPLAKPAAEEDEDSGILRHGRKNDQNAHEDLSKYFVDRSLRLARDGGGVGLVIPSVVYNGDGCVGIRQFLLAHSSVRALYGFENSRRIFPIHASYKFANLVADKGDDGAGVLEAAFMRRDVAELASNGPKPWMVRVTRAEIEGLSPETLALLEYRGPRDQDIVLKMSAGRPTLGGTGSGAWGMRPITWRQHEGIYNSADDRDLFTIPGTPRFHTPESAIGAASGDAELLVSRMRAAGFWPVYEGKSIDQYVVGAKPIRWWLSVQQATTKYNRPPPDTPLLVFRDIARNTDQRTCIATVLPRSTCASNTCSGATFVEVATDAALAVLNSICFDFLLRLRLAGTHVSFTYIRSVAVPPAGAASALPRIATRLAHGNGGGHISEDPNAWPALWAVDRAVAEAYGLGPDEFAHIFATFPVWQRKRPEIAAFYGARLTDWRGGALSEIQA